SLSRADETYDQLIACLKQCNFDFELGNDAAVIEPLVEMAQQMIAGMRLTDATGRFRIGAALKEALLNAIYRGNLEISFKQMQDTRVSLVEGKGEDLLKTRKAAASHKD